MKTGETDMSQVVESKEMEECLWSPEGCIPLKLLVDPKKSEEYACYLCGMVCRDACEMVAKPPSFSFFFLFFSQSCVFGIGLRGP